MRFFIILAVVSACVIIGLGVYAAAEGHAFADQCRAKGGVVVSNSMVRRVCVDASVVR